MEAKNNESGSLQEIFHISESDTLPQNKFSGSDGSRSSDQDYIRTEDIFTDPDPGQGFANQRSVSKYESNL